MIDEGAIDGIRDEVNEILALALGLAEVPAGISQDDFPSWDSIKHVQIVFALEDAFDVSFDLDDFAELTSTDAIAARIAERRRTG